MLHFRSSTEKRKCQDSQWSFSHSAVAKLVGNAFLVTGDADIYKSNSKAAENVCFLIPAELREFIVMEWSRGNLSVFITFLLTEEAKQLSHHLIQSEFASELLPSALSSMCPLSLILVSHWLRICHISQGDQEIHLASPRSFLPFLFLFVFYQTRCAFSRCRWSRCQVSCCSKWKKWRSHMTTELLLSSRILVKVKDQALVGGVVVNLHLLLLAPRNLFWSAMLLPSNMLCVWKTECSCSVVCLLPSASWM